jgi:hypothetical protein
MGPFVHDPALGGVTVLRPDPVHVDQGALALAIEQVLQGGKGDKLLFHIR